MNLVWFRNDLRLHDQPALHAACHNGQAVLALFIISPQQWQQQYRSARQVDLLRRSLICLKQDLARLNIPLKILNIPLYADIPIALTGFCQQYQISQVYCNQEYEWNERLRDRACKLALDAQQIGMQRLHDQCLLPPKTVLNQSGEFYKVFTPFKNNWLNQLNQAPPQQLPCPQPVAAQTTTSDTIPSDNVPSELVGFAPLSTEQQTAWPADEAEAQRRLQAFIQWRVSQYSTLRNRPDKPDYTSQLSAYLALGRLSNRQCYLAAQEVPTNEGIQTWISELCWRDFYRHMLIGFPRVSRGQAFDVVTDRRVAWSYDQVAFEHWCQGKTGIPLVDAAMRCLNATGFMHNRLRMVVAMFLTKNLLIDWRWGERYFSQQLIDCDLASNNGGWQWSASTGNDAAPYFRVMNPSTQGKTYDPDGIFIKQWLPELRQLTTKQIHDLSVTAKVKGYCAPMVDLKASRVKAIEAFKQGVIPVHLINLTQSPLALL